MHIVIWNDYKSSHSVSCSSKDAFHLAILLEKVPSQFEVYGIHVYFNTSELNLQTGNYEPIK